MTTKGNQQFNTVKQSRKSCVPLQSIYYIQLITKGKQM